MDQYSLSNERPLPEDLHLPPFSEGQSINCSDALSRDLGPGSRNVLYAGLSGLNLELGPAAPEGPSEALEDNLDALSLYSGKNSDPAKLLEECADPESQVALQDLGLSMPKAPKEVEEVGRVACGSSRKGRRQHSSPQNPLLDCSLCGKVFSSASSLSKHYLTHSQERKHVCKICSKAFKRQDHLTGHMLTHQKTKPFVCMEQGCAKSYCDYRSLRRHYEVQHGLCVLKEVPLEEEVLGDSPHTHEAASLRPLGPPEARSPGTLLPSRDLLRRIVSSIVHQKLPSPGPALADSEGRGAPEGPPSEAHALQKEPTEAFTSAHSRVVAAVAAAANGGPDLVDSEPLPLPLQAALDSWPDGSVGSLAACLPCFRGQAGPPSAPPASHSFQWLRNLPSGPKSKANNVLVVHKSPAVAATLACETLQTGPGPSATSPNREPTSSLGPPEVPREKATGDPRYPSGEEDTWAAKKSKLEGDALGWLGPGEPGTLPPDATPLFRQLFLKSQDPPLVGPEHMQVLQMLAKSQRLFSHAQASAGSSSWAQQTPLLPPPTAAEVVHAGAGNPEPEGSPARRRKGPATFPRESSPGSGHRDAKGGTKTTAGNGPLTLGSVLPDAPGTPDLSSLAKQLRSSKGNLDLGDIFPAGAPRQAPLGGDEPSGGQLSGKQAVDSSLGKADKVPACPRGGSYRLLSGNPRAQRFSGFRKEKVKLDLCCAASPSQVAMASFSSLPPADATRDAKSKLTIFNRVQGGNIYRLPHPIKEATASVCSQQNGSPGSWAEPGSAHICKNCSQTLSADKGLGCHPCHHGDQWMSPQGKLEPQVFGSESCKPPRQLLRPEGPRQCSPGTRKSLDGMALAPGVGTASVPVTSVTQPSTSTAKGQEREQEDRDCREGLYRKRKKRPQPKALFISPPPAAPSSSSDPGQGGCHQSCLRSPVFLVDRLLKGLFRCSPFTPPPMLSPIREGSRLYFNVLCSVSTHVGPGKLPSSTLDQADSGISVCVLRDDTKISIEPHINIGSRFQAEVPELREPGLARAEQRGASLVWKPWGDVTSNPKTQDRVAELCNVACSSVMPGGGTNLELALHCLHEAQGNVQVALETLLLSGPQKLRPHPLSDYRYTGSDIWTPMEKRLFKKAFCAHKKDFNLIHKMIQTKTVAQCVEYYYIWKKMIRFDCGRIPGLEKRVKREADEMERTETKVICSPRERPGHRPTPELKIKTKSYRRDSILDSSPNTGPKRTPEPPGSVGAQGVFPCRECERVFDKIKSRNAHMKRHRLQDHVEPVVRVKWPVKPFQLKEDEEEEEELGADMGPLQW
ncbi:zinc finger protein 541 [Suncus etruscus]|uniref:zinc finger protein 541 n=1 Tax=Suncus etruscus TaxID=109475 RepID=UPI002110C068|nr:zinc finger protein 541 [Suncus etruscus]